MADKYAFVVYAEYPDETRTLIGVALTLPDAREMGKRHCDLAVGWAGWKDAPEGNAPHLRWSSWGDDPRIVIYRALLLPSLNASQYTYGSGAV